MFLGFVKKIVKIFWGSILKRTKLIFSSKVTWNIYGGQKTKGSSYYAPIHEAEGLVGCILIFTQPILQDDCVSTSIIVCVCPSVCVSVSHAFPASPEEGNEKEIQWQTRGEGQFMSDLWEWVFPRDQLTKRKKKEEVMENRFIVHITSEATLLLSSTAYNT